MKRDILVRAFNKAPGESVDYLAKKVSRSSWNWWDSLDKSFEGSFTIAATASADMVESVRKALLDAQAKGLPFAAFQKQIEPTLRALGWWGKDPATGATLGTPWRLETIYRTNLQSSFNAGRMERQQKTEKFRPLLEYVAVLDSKTRPSHSALDGKVVPASDPFWNDFYPPNGFNCRCRVRSLSEAEARREGKDVERFDGKISREEVTINKDLGIKTEVAVVNIGGTNVSPDPGFSRRPSILPPPPNPSGGKYPTTGPKLAEKISKAPEKAKEASAAVVPPKLVKTPKQAPANLAEMIRRSSEEIREKIGPIEAAKSPFKFQEASDIYPGKEGKIYSTADGFQYLATSKAAARAEAVFSKPTFFEQVEEYHKNFTFNRTGNNLKRLEALGEFDSILASRSYNSLRDHLLEKVKELVPNYYSMTEVERRVAEGKILGLHSIEEKLPPEVKLSGKLVAPPPGGRRASFLAGNIQAQESKLLSEIAKADEFIETNISPDILPPPEEFAKLNLATEKMEKNILGYYRDATKEIRFDRNIDYHTLAHEFTHFIHYHNERLIRATNEFFSNRVDGNSLYNHFHYGWTADDKFSEEYLGRVYQKLNNRGKELPPKIKKATTDPEEYSSRKLAGIEVLTRSTDLFKQNPIGFFISDPETFAFSRAALLGDLPK